jgi:hypothetical protein
MTNGVCRRAALLAAGAAAALFGLGCGGGGDGGTTASTPPATVAEFVERGNAICKEGNEDLASGIQEFAEDNGLSGSDQPSQEQLEGLATEVLLPSIDEQIGKLRELGAPKGQEGEVERFLDNAEAAIDELEADPSMLTGQRSPFADVNREAVALGLIVCGQKV